MRESEFTDRDRGLLLGSWEAQHEPRGPHGIPIADATDPSNNPFAPDAAGRFVAKPVIDFAQDAIDRAREARRKSMQNPDDDWALRWEVELEKRVTTSET